jgi:O-antigen/teichoic acid export membrane protein
MRSILAGLAEGSFFRDVAKLSAGTLGGRIIAIAALPLLTRLYSPEDFALLAVYLAIVSTIAVAACLRFEVAIPLAENDDDAAHLLVLSLSAALCVSLLVALAVVFFPSPIGILLGKPALTPFLWLVPLGILMAAGYSATQYWATRAQRFGLIAQTRVTQAGTGVAVMLGMGWLGLAPLGLLIGNMLNIGSGAMRLAAVALRRDVTQLRVIRFSGLRETLRRYRRYPIYSMPEALINVAGIQVPVIVIAAFAGAEAGFLFLAMQVMTAPMTLLGGSISQVYMSRAPEELREGRLAPFTLGIMQRLLQVGTGPLIFIGVTAPVAFLLIFGDQWGRSGQIVAWLVPWMALQFIASPVSMVMYVTGRQREMFVLTLLGLILRVGGVAIAAVWGGEAFLVIGLVIGSSVYYALVLAFVTQAAGFRFADYRALLHSILSWTIPVSIFSSVIVSQALALLISI